MSSKRIKCTNCNGNGKIFIYSFGTVIDSKPCDKCKGTGKVAA